jgi:hypothetical protein
MAKLVVLPRQGAMEAIIEMDNVTSNPFEVEGGGLMPKRLGRTAPPQAHQGAVAGPGDHESRITPRMVFLFDASRTLV